MPGGPVATSPARRARGLFPSGLHFLKQQSRLTGVGKQRQSLPWSLPWLPRTPDPASASPRCCSQPGPQLPRLPHLAGQLPPRMRPTLKMKMKRGNLCILLTSNRQMKGSTLKSYSEPIPLDETLIYVSPLLQVTSILMDKALGKPRYSNSHVNHGRPGMQMSSCILFTKLKPPSVGMKLSCKPSLRLSAKDGANRPPPVLFSSIYTARSFPLPINNCRTRENRKIRNRPLHKYHSAKKEDLIPLCIEDELKNPKAKIIDISTTKRGTSHMEQSETHPMIFHDSRHIQALLLRRNRFSSHFKEREHFYQYRRTNFVLERNCAILKSLIREPSVPVCKPQGSLSTAEKGAIKAIATEMIHRAVHDKPKMQISSQATTIKPWSKFHNLSQTFSNLTKKFVGYFDKTIIHEGSAGSGKVEEIASTMRPISSPKIYTSSIKCYPKHVKNVLAVHRIDNLSPLDDLLTSSRKI
ncbi:uncharacterized protein C1orf141 homolog [Dipodomys spectabilis]|uniref:uncharacterized protein C1orf141 homolog n=1 Tax=Dipodomys spectabilis TaxID=105255 RepID=UPI001C5446F5|nr:uncharacterized protein C1orf141 homolog [Dipodomys spectabilis]